MAELQRSRRTRFRIVIAAVLLANVLLFSGLLIQGCQRQSTTGPIPDEAATVPAADTNSVARQEPAATNSTPSFQPPSTNAVASAEPPSPPPVPPSPTNAKDYVVVKGDSFHKIARANKISVQALTQANSGVDSTKLKIGQTLHIPGAVLAQQAADGTASGTPPVASAAITGPTSAGIHYVVKSGDTLGRIAKTHHTTIKAIKAANGLMTDRIAVGKSLTIPGAKGTISSSAQG